MSRLMIVEVPSYSCEFRGIREICELVRCCECKYWGGCKSTAHNSNQCGRMAEEQNLDYWTRADDYCSYGERKGADDE